MFDVPVQPRRFEPMRELIGEARFTELVEQRAVEARELLGDRAVWNINSTASGGGVAEMFHVLLGSIAALGVEARWAVIEGNTDFFTVTKRLHNHLYGGVGDGGPLGDAERIIYRDTLAAEIDGLQSRVRPGDIVILHDPQPAGLAPVVEGLGAHLVWRCHVGIDHQNDNSELGWAFLRPHLEPHVDHYVFTRRQFAPSWVPADRLSAIRPSVDPFSPKNQKLDDAVVEAILTHCGLLDGSNGPRDFVRADGTAGTVERTAELVASEGPPPPSAPLVVQVSRWDVMKDMQGVLVAFADHVPAPAHLMLVGPSVAGVSDDPEGGQVLEACRQTWLGLPDEIRARVHLVCLPMDDLEENAAIVNALQHWATVVAQKSLAEGFGLTVVEAMLKGTPVVATAVGGIVDQVADGASGFLIDDPRDLEGFAAAVNQLLNDPELANRMGHRARADAIAAHLSDTHLQSWLAVMQMLLR